MIKYALTILVLAFALSLSAQFQFSPGKIGDVTGEAREGTPVSVKGDVVSVEKDGFIELSDGSGTIMVDLDEIKDKEYSKGDHLTVNGKLRVTDSGEKIISATYLRKHKYVKDPSQCCRPEDN